MILDPATGLDARISNMRNHIAREFGFIIPEIRLTDDASLPTGTYAIQIQGVEQAKDVLKPDCFLAILPADSPEEPGAEDIKEPVYGAPARWISEAQHEDLALSGATIVTPTEVLATHLLETLKSNFSRLLNLKSLRRLLEEFVNLSEPARAEKNVIEYLASRMMETPTRRDRSTPGYLPLTSSSDGRVRTYDRFSKAIEVEDWSDMLWDAEANIILASPKMAAVNKVPFLDRAIPGSKEPRESITLQSLLFKKILEDCVDVTVIFPEPSSVDIRDLKRPFDNAENALDDYKESLEKSKLRWFSFRRGIEVQRQIMLVSAQVV